MLHHLDFNNSRIHFVTQRVYLRYNQIGEVNFTLCYLIVILFLEALISCLCIIKK